MSDHFLYSVRLIGMVAVIYVAILLVKTRLGRFNRTILILYFAGTLAYLLISAGYPSVDKSFRLHFGPLFIVLFILASLVPWLLMLLSRSFFLERVSVPIWAAVLVAVQLILEVVGYLRTDCDYELSSACTYLSNKLDMDTLIFTVLPSGIAAVFFGLAVFWTLRDWRRDLVEQRRQIRRVFTVLLGTLGLGIVVIEDLSLNVFRSTYPLVTSIDSILLALLFVVISLMLLFVNPATVMEELVANKSPPLANNAGALAAKQKASPALAQLLGLMETGCYREPGLNVAGLAAKMSLPQYQLRQLINKHLGFRNFNGFLNHYRIEDACQQLADPKKAHMTVLDVALNVGFGSITSFNDAFKRQMQTTPTAFRKDQLG